MTNSHKQSFIRLFGETARYRHRYEVFSDFVTMAGTSVHNALLKDQDLEDQYLKLVKKYEKEDVYRMSHLLGEVVMGLDAEPCDFLGSVFMELELGNSRAGQFFTPYDVSRLMADLVHGGMIDELSGKPFITLQEPACGAGGMVIAFAEAMLERGLNPQQQLWVQCVDVDHVAAMMCYLQLSLLNIPAEVAIGNTLAMSFSRVLRTPAHHMGFWGGRLRKYWDEGDSSAVDLPDTPGAMTTMNTGQLALFDIVA